MNTDLATNRRFLSRVLEFLACRDDLIAFACGAIRLHRAAHPCRFAALVAQAPRAFQPVIA